MYVSNFLMDPDKRSSQPFPPVMSWNWRRYPPCSPPIQQGPRFHWIDPTTGVRRDTHRSRLCRLYGDPAIGGPQLGSDDEELHHSGCANLQPNLDQSGVWGVCSGGMELKFKVASTRSSRMFIIMAIVTISYSEQCFFFWQECGSRSLLRCLCNE